jgi:hypothetical protein
MFLLPIYFQSIKGASAIKSGIDNLPTVAFFALGVSQSPIVRVTNTRDYG